MNKTEKKSSIPENAGSVFFNKKALDRLQSPEDLDKYLQTTTPGAWAMLFACATLLVGLLIWCVFGSVSERINLTGIRVEYEVDGENRNVILMFANAEEASKIELDDQVYMDGKNYEVASVVGEPLDQETLTEVFGLSPLYSTMLLKDERDFGIVVIDKYGDLGEENGSKLVSGSVLIDESSPIKLLFGN